PERRQAAPRARRTTPGSRRPTCVSRPPRGAPAAESCSEGLASNTAITADLKPACHRKVAGTQSRPAAHESLATRVLDPTLSTAERAGGVGGALGNPSSYVGPGVPAPGQAGGGPDSPIGFPKAPPAPPARWIGGDWVAIVSNGDTTGRSPSLTLRGVGR